MSEHIQRRIRRSSPRRGVTLIELLIVIFIIVGVTAVAIRQLAPSLEQRRVTEAARTLAGTLGSARSRAVELGRPVGVTFHRVPGTQYASTISFAEVPPAFTGGFVDSEVRLGGNGDSFDDANGNGLFDSGETIYKSDGTTDGDGKYEPWGIAGFTLREAPGQFIPTPDRSWLMQLRNGDRIRIGHQGHVYRIWVRASSLNAKGFIQPGNGADGNWGKAGVDDDGNMSTDEAGEAGFHHSDDDGMPWALVSETSFGIPIVPENQRFVPYETQNTVGAPYQIERLPQPSSHQPVTLNREMIVDLAASGFPGTGDLTVMFAPNGAIDAIYDGTIAAPTRPFQPVAFLIGRRPETIQINELNNWHNPENEWVVVGNVNGKVSTFKNPAIPLFSAGPDGKWGDAGTDDNGSGGTDEVAEAGVGDDVALTKEVLRQRVRELLSR